MSDTVKPIKQQEPLGDTLHRAGKRALGGGVSGAAAMAVQVLTLFPMRTIMNTQYRHGGTFRSTTMSLLQQNGFRRFYSGMTPALLQAPLSRFGDTASNAFALSFLDSFESTAALPIAIRTLLSSVMAGAFRILLVPVDTVKTIMQVEGQSGLTTLRGKINKFGPTALFHGAMGTAVATTAGHYPWFATFNYLQATIPLAFPLTPNIHTESGSTTATTTTTNTSANTIMMWKLLRNAGIGFTSSVVSDTLTNSLRVLKTYKQTSAIPISYPNALREVIAKDGLVGLFGRGLKTRLAANGLQGLLFSVLWKEFEAMWNTTHNNTQQR